MLPGDHALLRYPWPGDPKSKSYECPSCSFRRPILARAAEKASGACLSTATHALFSEATPAGPRA